MRGLFLRITPDDSEDHSLDSIVEMLVEASYPERYVISREKASRVHYHALLYTDFSPERLRYRIKSNLSAQVYISGKDIQDKVNCIAYTIKDGEYRMKGIDVFEWMNAKRIAHKKVTFDDAISTIEKNYNVSRDDEALVQEIIQAHVDFKRKMYRHHLKGWFDTIKLRVSHTYREKVMREILGLW